MWFLTNDFKYPVKEKYQAEQKTIVNRFEQSVIMMYFNPTNSKKFAKVLLGNFNDDQFQFILGEKIKSNSSG